MQEFTDQMPSDIERFPMVPIRDVVIFPYTKVAFKIGRPSSVRPRLVNRRVMLGREKDASLAGHRLFQRPHRGWPPDLESHLCVGKNNYIADRDHREPFDVRGHLIGKLL